MGRKIPRATLTNLTLYSNDGVTMNVSLRDGNPRLVFKKANYHYKKDDYSGLCMVRMTATAFFDLLNIIREIVDGTQETTTIEYVNLKFDENNNKTGTGVDSTLKIELTKTGIVLTAKQNEDTFIVPISLDPKWFHVKLKDGEVEQVRKTNLRYAKSYCAACDSIVGFALAKTIMIKDEEFRKSLQNDN